MEGFHSRKRSLTRGGVTHIDVLSGEIIDLGVADISCRIQFWNIPSENHEPNRYHYPKNARVFLYTRYNIVFTHTHTHISSTVF